MSSLKNYFSLIKFSHTVFAMPFAVIGFFLGASPPTPLQQVSAPLEMERGEINWKIFFLVILCMIFARSAAMAFNRWADYKFDRKNIRTKSREIPQGIISEKNALTFAIVNSILFIATAFFINKICFYLSPVALVIILGYSYTKQFTSLCHFILGLGLSLAPIGAYLSVTGEFKLLPVLFSCIILFWVSGFDIIYALQDEEFDRLQNLKSIPVLLGKKNALLLSRILHLISSVLVLYAGYYAEFETWYWAGGFVFIALLAFQQSMVHPDDLSKVNIAFFTTNGIASIVFSFFVLLELYV